MQISNKFFNSPLWSFLYRRLSSEAKINVHTCILEFIICCYRKVSDKNICNNVILLIKHDTKRSIFWKGSYMHLLKFTPFSISITCTRQVHVNKRLANQYNQSIIYIYPVSVQEHKCSFKIRMSHKIHFLVTRLQENEEVCSCAN